MTNFRSLIEIRECVDLFDKADLLSSSNEFVNLPLNYVSQTRGLFYNDYWDIYNRNFWYHIKIKDESLILFEEDSFRFIMSPISIPSHSDFIAYDLGTDWDDFNDNDKKTYLTSDYFKDAYEKYIETTSEFKSHTPVRLDQHPHQYKAITHPAHHLHIGYENESRIPVKRILNPQAFSAFIISTFYPKSWEILHNNGVINIENIQRYKTNLSIIGHIYQNLWDAEFEENRLYLG
jgi:hypothetical protein